MVMAAVHATEEWLIAPWYYDKNFGPSSIFLHQT